MKPERFKRTKSVVAASAIALVVAALVMGLSSLVLSPRSASPQRPGFQLTNNPSTFSITSTFYKTPSGPYPASTCSGSGTLVPGVTLCVVFSITNTLNVPISVTGITSALDPSFPTPPAMCMGSYLTLPTFAGSVLVQANGSAKSSGVPITLKDSTTANQDACQMFQYHFTYTGTAQYTDATTTTLATGAPEPSYPGNPVSFTATVNAANGSADTYGPGSSSETGTKQVNFFYCSTPSCTPTTPLGSATLGTNNAATISTSAFTSPGTYVVDAVYTGSGTNGDFSASPSSNVVTQTVQLSSACVSPPTSGANVILTGTTNGNYTVPSGKSVWLNGGTITGNVTVPANGSFAATKGTLKGNLSSSGGPISLQGTTVSGNITSTGGGVAIGPGSVLSGNLTDSGAGSVCAVGTSPSPVQISGSISVENQPTSSVPNSFCALTLKTNLTYETNGAPVVIGGSSACPGDTISGNVLVESNTAPVTVGGSGFGNTVKTNLTVESNAGTVTVYGNTVSGNIAVESNTVGGGTLTSNSASGTCTLSGNKPQITVPSSTSNTAKGTNNCKASG